MKSYVEPISSRPHLSSANEGLDYSVTLPNSLMMSQQTRSFGPAAKLKMVSGHHPTGGVLEVDLPPPGFIRSAGTREYWWLMLLSWQKTSFWRQIATAGCYSWTLRMMMMMMMMMMWLLSGYMPQVMANAIPAALPMMHGGSRGNMYKYPPMTMHNTQQQQHIYQQTVQHQVPPSTVATQPVLASKQFTILDVVGRCLWAGYTLNSTWDGSHYWQRTVKTWWVQTGWPQTWQNWNTQGFLWTWKTQGILCSLREKL